MIIKEIKSFNFRFKVCWKNFNKKIKNFKIKFKIKALNINNFEEIEK